MNAALDLKIAKDVLGYPKEGWIPALNTEVVNGQQITVCRLYFKGRLPCECKSEIFSPSSNWALAGTILEKHGVRLGTLLAEALNLNTEGTTYVDTE